MKHDPLLDDLRAVFPAQPIAAATAFEQRGQLYCDAHEYCAQLDGRTWEQVDPHYVARRSDALSFLGDEHLRAVLPMYLHLLLVLQPTSPVPETLLPLLTRPERTDQSRLSLEWKQERFEWLERGLSCPQKQVVAGVLHRFIELYPNYTEPAYRALERYWGAFAKAAPMSTG